MIIRRLGLSFVVGSVVVMAACGGSGGGGSTVTSVSVSCSPSTVSSGGTSQCTAIVNGTGNFNTAVNWSASAGSISSTGLLTAPQVTTSLLDTITATSVQNQNVSGTATVTVNPASAGNNVAPLVVDQGPQPQNFISTNVVFTTVTVCVPGTNTCQTIDHIMVDTGSTGLRLISGVLQISLPGEKGSSGNPLDECLAFLDGYVWGPVVTADVSMGGESASAVPVQVIIPSTSSPPVPGSCSSNMGMNEGGSVQTFGANGLVGVGLFQQDCGPACTSQNSSPPNVYYDCPSSGCSETFVDLSQQVTNPVFLFPTDNNGVLIQLPSVPDGGSPTAQGSLIFGIGTQSNNGLGSAQVYAVPDSGNNAGNFTTFYNNHTYPGFVDSGSNGFFFQDSSIPICGGMNTSWYCPTNSPDNLSASNQGTNMNSPVTANFSVENADNLFSTNNTAFSTLGGPFLTGCGTGMNPACAFDWGLPFFYGRNVFTAIENATVPGTNVPGPFVAF